MRQCGDCQLCCKLLPLSSGENAQATRTAAELIKHRLLSLKEAADMVKIFDKPAGQRCPHQRHGKGCAIYAKRPLGCRVWNCRWLVNDDADDLRRPDRSHYVIDVMPDFVTLVDNETGVRTNIEVVQIWVDPDFPDAHREPELRDYIERRGENGIAAIIRYSEIRAITIFPPSMSKDGEWHEVTHGVTQPTRTAGERLAGIASAQRVKIGG
jgi:hypothetical protein